MGNRSRRRRQRVVRGARLRLRAYLFGEWMYAGLGGLGSRPQMHIGASTWVAGLAFDM